MSQILSLSELPNPSKPKSPKDTTIHTMVTQKKDKKIKLSPKTKSSGWTLDNKKFWPLSKDRLKELVQLRTIHGGLFEEP